ncbi:MAG: hypothetical protein KA522_03015 [Candidatus Saccharicenans sp.]|nr:hypothetical protein [Candidatus Saccharicenans sp.]
MIDLHCHLLPDWDDGPESWEEVDQMMALAAEDGIEAICITPHYLRFSRHGNNPDILRSKFEEFFERYKDEKRIRFYRGAEVFVHPDIIKHVKRENLRLNGSEYVFVEFPSDQVPAGTKDLFYRMMLAGLTPVISHPERNAVFGSQPELLYDLIGRGCLAQITAMSLTGQFGSAVYKRSELFLKNNLVQFIATDAHDSKKRKPVLSKAVKMAASLVGKEKAQAMVNDIPLAILNNEVIPDWGSPLRPGKGRRRFFILGRR